MEVGVTGITFLASAWLAWRLAAVVAEAIIASPHYGSESLDAHVVRGGVRLLGIVVAAAMLALVPTASECRCMESSQGWE